MSGRAARASMITTMRCELGRGSRESITNSSSDQSRGAGLNWAPSTRHRAATNAFKSLSNVEWSRRTLCKRASAASAAGRSSELGGSAPSTNTGMTLTRRWSAAAISSTTRSFESSRRRRPRASMKNFQPSDADQRQQHVASTDRALDDFAEIESRFDGVDVHEDGVITEGGLQPVAQATRDVLGVRTAIADEDPSDGSLLTVGMIETDLDAEAERPELLAAVFGDLVGPPRRHPDPVDLDVVDEPPTSAARVWSSITSVRGQAALVSVMSITATPSDSWMPYTRPRSTTLMPSSGSTTSRIASSRSSIDGLPRPAGGSGIPAAPRTTVSSVCAASMIRSQLAHAFSSDRTSASLNAIQPSKAHFTRAG